MRPIANALLDIENEEEYDDADTKAYKSILKLKMSVIDENSKKIAELQEQLEEVSKKEKSKYLEKLAVETDKFQQSLDFCREQIALKDKRIDQLMATNDRLSITNDRLINQLMDCPLRKECDE